MKQRYALRMIVTPSGALDQIAEPLSLWGYLVFLFKRRFELQQAPGLMGVIKRDAPGPERRTLGRFVHTGGKIVPFTDSK